MDTVDYNLYNEFVGGDQMLKLNLERLMKDNKINISKLSELTGLSRSTITPLVKYPENVLSVKLETIDILCNFFEVSDISQLITFVNPKRAYQVSQIWGDGQPITFMLLENRIGTKVRNILLAVQSIFVNDYDYNNANESYFVNVVIEALGSKRAKKIIGNKKDASILDGEALTEYLKSHGQDAIKEVTKMVIKGLLRSKAFKENPDTTKVVGFQVAWHFESIVDSPQYNTFFFKLDNGTLSIKDD